MDLFENLQIMSESTNEDFVKQECEKYGFNKPSYGSGYMELYLEPSDKSAEEFIKKIEADGYKFIEEQKDGLANTTSENDVTLVYGKEVGENRCIIAVVIHPSEDYVIATCGYNEDESDNEFFENAILKNNKDIEEVVEASILKDEKDVETVVEQKIIKDEKDIEQVVEGTQTLTEDSDNILDLVEAKSKRFGAMVDAIGEDMPTSEVNDFLKGLTTELDMDVYEGDKPYPTDLAGYFGQPVDELDINNSDDLEMINWIDGILTGCIDKMNDFITSRIETLRGEISAIEGDIEVLKSVL